MANIYLHLEDGTRFAGESFGHNGESSGEVVFSTGMTGYGQSLTDPSFAGQILTFTYPLIGNYGVPKPQKIAPSLMGNFESERIWTKGVVVSEYCQRPSHHASLETISTWLLLQKIPGISGIDTRALTIRLRTQGVMRGIISPHPTVSWKKPDIYNWVSQTSCRRIIDYPSVKSGTAKHIVLIDCGVKHGIIRALLGHGFRVTRIPWDKNPLDISHIDGVVCSNGPGDPKICLKTVENIQKVLAADIPFLGICLGHQLLALAIGADTYKLPFGHRGLNQPCQDRLTGKAYITSQNHGYAVDRNSIPKEFEEWFTNLNDQTNEGLRHKKKFIRSVQFHPEGNPGPFDSDWVFDYLA